MIPRIASTGRSFKGSFAYLMHDKEQSTRERVDWTETMNMLTDDPDKAWKVMAYTALESERLKEASGQKLSGRKLEKPVLHYSLAWHPEENPAKETMQEAALQSLEKLGLSEHEAMVIAHRDEPQKHVHVVVNRVHPVTGLTANLSQSKRKLSEFALQYEKEHGKIYCQQREENFQKRQQEGKKTMYRDPVIQSAWKNSDTGASFVAALEDKDYQLAQGRKRIVVVDARGKVHNPVRHLEGVRAKEFNERLKDLDLSTLPDATEVSRQIEQRNKQDYQERQEKRKASAEALNELQISHLDQKSELFNRHSDRIERERSRLEEHYRIREQKKAIEALEKKTNKSSLFRRLFRYAKKDREQLVVLRQNYDNAEERLSERIAFLEKEQNRAIAALNEKQSTEKHLLMEHGPDALEAWRNRHREEAIRLSQDRARTAPALRR